MKRFLVLALVLAIAGTAYAGPFRQMDFLVTGLFGTDGAPLASGSVTFYLPGTTSTTTVYLDPSGSSPAANPITLDSYGRPNGTTYGVVFTNRSLKVVAKDVDGVTRGTFDYLYYGPATASTEVREVQVATYGQTIFNLTNAYTVGDNSLACYIDGVRQQSADYTETSTTKVTFGAGMPCACEVEFVIRKE